VSVSLLQLWMPILLGTVLAWVASALIHMVVKYHNADYLPVPNEVSDTLQRRQLRRGNHSASQSHGLQEVAVSPQGPG